MDIPMEPSNILGLPDFIYKLLQSKCKDVHSKLDFNISGTGDNIEITLRWRKWGSRWEDPFDYRPMKYKSFSNRKRDSYRRKMYNVDRNSKSVNTENIDAESQTGLDICDTGLASPISAPQKTLQQKSEARKSTTQKKAHMVLRSSVAEGKETRRKCESVPSAADILSPISVDTSQYVTDMSMTMTDHEGHGQACSLEADYANDNTNLDSSNTDSIRTGSDMAMAQDTDDSYTSDLDLADEMKERITSLKEIVDQLKAVEDKFDRINEKQEDFSQKCTEIINTVSNKNPK